MAFRELSKPKQALSKEECEKILREQWRAFLSINGDDGYPYCFPIDFYYDAEKEKIYFHSRKKGYKIEKMLEDPKVCLTVMGEAVPKQDSWGNYVKSVIIFGTVRFLENGPEKNASLRKFAAKYMPTQELIEHNMEKDGLIVALGEITIENLCGKVTDES